MEKKLRDITSISIRLASPEEILEWSHGEVTKPETLNYRTQRPEKHGLFSERIFGPTKDYECYCGKYRKFRYKGIVCEKCGVEVTRSVVRRERLGHVALAVPVSHIWFLRTVPSKLSLILDISVPKLEKVIYYAAFIVMAVNEEAKKRILGDIKREYKSLKDVEGKKAAETAKERSEDLVAVLQPGLILTEDEYYELSQRFGDLFEADRGAGAVRKILEQVDISKLHHLIVEQLETVKDFSRRRRMLRRLRVVKSFMRSGIRPEWMIMTHVPILPPDLRPMVALDGGRYATADLNDLYRRVINRNNRLKKLLDLHAPDVIITNEKRMLQEAVDALIDNTSRTGGQILSSRRRPLKSLSDMLKGKQGRFRQNLLGKRVDYSGRSVIVIGPELDINRCGLPKKLALEIFRPFVIQKIIARELAHNIKQANRLIEHGPPEVWAILEEVMEHRRVLLNRAPTLHRLGVQAFKPLLIEDSAIRVPALVCDAFNADFDGDQMAVHLPLTLEAQYEAGELLDASRAILKPANGDPIADPSKDIVLGCFFLTGIQEGATGEGRAFATLTEALFAYEQGIIDITASITLPASMLMSEGELAAREDGADTMIETSYGRVVFNRILPSDFDFVNEHMDKKALSRLVLKIVAQYGIAGTSQYLDAIKRLGFSYSTMSAITWGMTDTKVPKEKPDIIAEGEKEVVLVESQYHDGLLTNNERREKVIEIWTGIREKIAECIPHTLTKKNPIYSIVDSGARGSWSQPIQMMGMKGLVINPRGEIIELPVKASYKEGLSVLEYFISTHGARKGSTDTALKTASAGYLTRRLVDVAQDVIIRGEDCKTKNGIVVARTEGAEYGYEFGGRLYARTVLKDIKVGGTTLVKHGVVITKEAAQAIQESDVASVAVRSPITCMERFGVCATCYGYDLSTGAPIRMGEAVGVVAAQSIGEPGTQLTMRTFHVGGVAGVDITHGLPRIEEIFEARTPKGKAPLVKADGVVTDVEVGTLSQTIRVKPHAPAQSKKKDDEYLVSANVSLYVKKGDVVEKGQTLCEGPLDVQEVFAHRGRDAAQQYIINEIQKIYVPEGASISDTHIEVIVRQMFARVLVKDPGDTELVIGEVIDVSRLREINVEMEAKGKEGVKFQQLILGITRVALTTESFLSAASFQETSRVLVNAAIEGRRDTLMGLKENVIIGKLIPVGTGSRTFSTEELSDLRSKLFPPESMFVDEEGKDGAASPPSKDPL